MKFRNLFFALFAAAAVIAGCKKAEDLGTPNVSLSSATMDFEKASGSQTLELTATRDWHADFNADWLVVEPKRGKGSASAQTIKITVLENKGVDRSETVKFNIGFSAKTLTVNQKGSGSAAENIVYYNNFDKEEAKKGDKGFPYLDKFDGWKNETGKGASSVEYAFKGTSVRNNSASNSKYSDCADIASGMNNIFFGKEPYFMVKNISLGSEKNYNLSFAATRFVKDADNTFNHEEFKVYVSSDSQKWVELPYKFRNGDKNGRWELANAKFSVPESTSKLSICVKASIASAYRIDDLKLELGTEAGTAVDFSKGVDLGLGGGTGGDTPNPPSGEIKAVTVAEFLAAPESKTQRYKLTGVVTAPVNTKYGNFDLKDESGIVYCYGMTATELGYGVKNDQSFSKTGVAEGDKLTLIGYRGSYTGKDGVKKDEIVYAHYVSHEKGTAPQPPTPGTEKTGTLAELASVANNTAVKTNEVLIVAASRDTRLLQEGEHYMFVYNASAGAVGDKVVVTGVKTEYNGAAQIGTKDTEPNIEVKSSNNEVKHPAAKVIEAANFDSYSFSGVEMISIKGYLSISGSYYNINVPGASKIASIVLPAVSVVPEKDNGKQVEVKGYYVYTSSDKQGKKYVNIVLVEYKVTGDKPEEINDDITPEMLKSNVAWTLGENAENVEVKINGSEEKNTALKIGTGQKMGNAKITLKNGVRKLGFFAVAWNRKSTVLQLKKGDEVVSEKNIAANSTLRDRSPFSLKINRKTYYFEVALPEPLKADTEFSFTTASGKEKRVVIFGIQAQ